MFKKLLSLTLIALLINLAGMTPAYAAPKKRSKLALPEGEGLFQLSKLKFRSLPTLSE